LDERNGPHVLAFWVFEHGLGRLGRLNIDVTS
jgi:hypothetical protein